MFYKYLLTFIYISIHTYMNKEEEKVIVKSNMSILYVLLFYLSIGLNEANK